MDTEGKLKQIMDVLDQIAEDTSVPRNIRRGAAEAKARLAAFRQGLRELGTSKAKIFSLYRATGKAEKSAFLSSPRSLSNMG